MSGNQVVDLTHDTTESEVVPVSSSAHGSRNQMWPQLGEPQLPPPPPIQVIPPYNIDNSLNYSSRPSSTPVYQGLWPTIQFSLISTTEFTARATSTVSKEVISTIQLVSGVRFDRERRQFVFPIACHSQLVAALGMLKVHVEPLPQESRSRLTLHKKMESSFCNEEFERVLQDKLPPRLLSALAHFQREGVQFVYKNKGRAIIADEMGLGKTIQAIASACLYRESWPILVVSPSSARHHWKMELETWLSPEVCSPQDIVIIDSPAKTHALLHTSHKFAILSYNYLTKLEEILGVKKYKMIIVDESHFLKNGKAKRTRSMNAIVESAARVLLLTGTPALSRPYELFTQLHLIAPMSWNSETDFCRRYCRGRGPGSGSWGAESKVGASNTAELHAMLFGTIMIRRLKKDTLTELPPKSRHLVKVEVMNEDLQDELKTLLKLIEANKTKRKNKVQQSFIDDVMNEKMSSNASVTESEQEKVVTLAPISHQAAEPCVSSCKLHSSVPDFSLPPSVYAPEIFETPRIHLNQNDSGKEGDGVDNYAQCNVKDQEQLLEIQQDSVTENKEETRLPAKRMLLMELFTKSGVAKVDMILQHMNTFLSDPLSGKLIVFAHHKKVLDRISRFLLESGTDYMRIDGSTPGKTRHQKMLRFQTVPACRVAVLAITAAGVAITLTAASSVFFAELFWTPGSMLQAEDRAHRIGQLSPVKITYFVGKNTVDELLWPLLQKKMRTLGELFEGVQNAELIEESSGIGTQALNRGGVVENPEVAGIVEDISLEEERKLLLRETELDEGEYDNSNGDDGSTLESSDDCVISNFATEANSNDAELIEYDGLAQAMLQKSSENSIEELILDDDNEGLTPMPLKGYEKAQDITIVDLVDEFPDHETEVCVSLDNKSESVVVVLDVDNNECRTNVDSTLNGSRAEDSNCFFEESHSPNKSLNEESIVHLKRKFNIDSSIGKVSTTEVKIASHNTLSRKNVADERSKLECEVHSEAKRAKVEDANQSSTCINNTFCSDHVGDFEE